MQMKIKTVFATGSKTAIPIKGVRNLRMQITMTFVIGLRMVQGSVMEKEKVVNTATGQVWVMEITDAMAPGKDSNTEIAGEDYQTDREKIRLKIEDSWGIGNQQQNLMMDRTPDKIQVEKIMEGDRQAFREILEKYHPMIINTCNGFLHNRQDAEDIAQEVFIEVFHSIKTFRHEAKLSTWIYRIAVNKSLNQVRKNKRWRWIQSIEDVITPGNHQREIVSNGFTADGEIESQQQKAILHSALNGLPENQRIAFTLNKYEELSYKEISEIMAVSLSSVESLIHRAKVNLQKKLLHLIEKS